MTLAITLVLVGQVDLDVTHVSAFTQIILSHQTVEADRRGGAGIDFVIGDFIELADVLPHFL